MKISVIIPFFRGIAYLEDCLNSLAEQTYQEMEVILVCDRVNEEIEPLQSAFQNRLELQTHRLVDKKGVAAARNFGLSVASGDYVYFLDSDDYISPNALEQLVNRAKETGADLIYGKKVWTWFKRSVFMANFNTEDVSEESSEDEEDNTSLETSELDTEDSAADGNKKKQTRLDASKKEIPVQELSGQKMAYYHLVSKEKGFRNISVLHQLMKRQVIEENKLRFKESIKFISDYPFELQFLLKARSFEYVAGAAYMKRNHGDTVNLPSLSQTKGSRSFREYTDSYKYTISLIQENKDLKLLLEEKMIRYCIGFYAPKLCTNHEDPERLKKFNTMHEIIGSLDKNLLGSYQGYDKKLMNAFCGGNIRRAERVVMKQNKWMEFKRITKNSRTFARHLYETYFLKMTLKEDWVIFESFFGKSYSDSPKYIYEYLAKNHPKKYKYIWVIDNKNTTIPYSHRKVKRFSFRYFYYMARSKYLVFNVRQPEWYQKRDGSVFLETWHGTPLKKLVYDLENTTAATQKFKKQTYQQSKMWDYLIAPNHFSSDTFRRCFQFHQNMLETGYPRNDILYAENKEEIAARVKDRIGISKEKKTILYAPTWRDDEFYTKVSYKFSLKLDLQLLKEKLGGEYVILLRTHYYIADALDLTGFEGFAYNLSNYNDISELYLISDILITDYSSVFFDYANLKRPMLFYTYDLEKYRDVLRGFYIDIEEELPGPLLYSNEDIITAIEKLDQVEQQYTEKYNKFYDKYCSWEDGHASQKVVQAVFHV
jgi:CDP-glycerol glycerophosphotransferase